MNTQQLECFVRVADKLNFTKAAEGLHISTPAVTHHIKNLEEELNTALFIRNSKMVKLTEPGALFYGEARDILQKMEMAEKKVKKLASNKMAVLRIGCSGQEEMMGLEKPLIKLREELPDVYPQVIVQDYFTLKSLFDNEQIDILIGTKEMAEEAHDCIFKKVRNIRSFAAVSKNSPLAAKNQVSFEELSDVQLIVMHPRFIPFQYGNKLQEFITLHGQNHFHIFCENGRFALLLAKCEYGTAILPEIYINDDEEIVYIPLEDGITEYGIAYHKNIKDRHIRQFVKYFTGN